MPDETNEQANEEQSEGDTSGVPVSGPMTPPGQGDAFTPSQHAYIRRQIENERKAAIKEFKDSEDYKTVAARARRANELEASGRQELEQLQAAVTKAEAERAGAMAMAENALRDAQITSILTQRGVPAERHQDAIALMDKSGVKVNLAGPTVTGAEEAVQTLIETKSYLVGPGIAPQTTHQARPAPNLNGGVTSAPVTDEARVAAVQNEMAARGLGRI